MCWASPFQDIVVLTLLPFELGDEGRSIEGPGFADSGHDLCRR